MAHSVNAADDQHRRCALSTHLVNVAWKWRVPVCSVGVTCLQMWEHDDDAAKTKLHAH